MKRKIFLYYYWIILLALLLSGCNLSRPTPTATSIEASHTSPPPSETALPTASSTPTATETPLPSDTPLPPTATPSSTDTPIPTDTPQPSDTPAPPTPTVDLPAAMASAKILLFEDNFWLDRYVKKALDDGGYTYVDTNAGTGALKKQLLSDTEWDLIIVSSEARGGISGEFFDYLEDQLDGGAAVILELWYLDRIAEGSIWSMLDKCGVEYQEDWVNPSVRSVMPLIPDHPLFNEPNQVSLKRFTSFWSDDVGDLIKKTRGSQAELVGGTDPELKNSNGLLATCFEGRLVLQTFCTHDFIKDNIVALWQNYIYYALKNHFQRP